MAEKGFHAAYQRGVDSVRKDYQRHWSVHIALWASRMAIKKNGDFVECGANDCLMSFSIMHDLDWSIQGWTFYLLNIFIGLYLKQVKEGELFNGILQKNAKLIISGFNQMSAENMLSNFSEWRNVEVIQGVIPETLGQIVATQISVLRIDLNSADSEIALFEYLWESFVSLATVLLGDYAYWVYNNQKSAICTFASCRIVPISPLTTCQRLFTKG